MSTLYKARHDTPHGPQYRTSDSLLSVSIAPIDAELVQLSRWTNEGWQEVYTKVEHYPLQREAI